MKARLPERRAGPGVRIRALRREDLPEVLAIERASFAIPWSERTFRGLLGQSNAVLLAAEAATGPPPSDAPEWGAASADGPPSGGEAPGEASPRPGERILGYAVVWVGGREAELGDLAVRAEARRRGVGTALVAAALAAAARQGAAQLFLEVREGNAAARRLYEKAGFEIVGRRPGYYARPAEDAVVMRRPSGPVDGSPHGRRSR